MNKFKGLINIGGKEVITEGYYVYETLEHVSICLGKDNNVISVENISKDKNVHINIEDDIYRVLSPEAKVSFGSLKLTKDQLKLVYRSCPTYDDEVGYEDCYD